MAREKTKYVCKECGYETPRWLGKCPSCGEWSSLVEEVITAVPAGHSKDVSKGPAPCPITELETVGTNRFTSGIAELDRVLGGGIVPGSVVLIGGDPGIGKSTLLLQVSGAVSTDTKVLYVSGEESSNQVKLRGDRLGIRSDNLLILPEVDLERIEYWIENTSPGLVVIDSIQTVFTKDLTSAPGSVSQVSQCASRLMRKAKELEIPICLVGHVTKQGAIAGPKVLEHIVDTVLYFEGERHHSFRILRCVKNRFGSTNEIGVFQMGDSGLSEITNPSEVFLSGRSHTVAGSCVTASVEGTRPILVEIEALVTRTPFGVPRRTTTGIDSNRVAIILAVLEKRAGLGLSMCDVYVSVAGGARLNEPATDLAVACAVASSFRNALCHPDVVIIGEVGLSGEIRGVSRIESRVAEAAKIGFKKCIIPASNRAVLTEHESLQVIPVRTISEALEHAMKR
ncbi:MAG: DNA repair protein RadA [Bacillota bacterium]|jgi:DNA repair protein RadA/Sms|nr:DNA repair protein RadA [Bacillota bacterium]MDI9416093.1 DNA repair protein RadA [Bacillota bacterium]HOB88866.1 DNA repair protein RadA [Bacillota bacterium]HOJ57845.1 DNA repair protein RadA [Bacillota bacterium]HOL02142.1 DNA repair protein RadA [Bacillota bacterium]